MSLTRRVALRRIAAAGAAGFGLLHARASWAQFGGELEPPPAPDPKFPPTPGWESLVKEVAPGAYAFIQGGGPGKDNVGVSNCGFIVGPDGVLVIDTTWAPLHAMALRDAIRKVTVPAHTYGDTVVYLQADRGHAGEDTDPGHGPIGGKAELPDMRGWIELLKTEARLRYDRGMSVGAAAAQIRLGRYDNWVGPERLLMGVQRFYQEFGGKLTSEMDAGALNDGTRDYNAARKNMLQGAKP